MKHSASGMAMQVIDGPLEDPRPAIGGADILRILRQRLPMILLIVAVGMTGTGLWLARQVPVYAAVASILLKSSELPSETVATEPAPGLITSTQVFTEAEVLRSRQFAGRLAQRLDLMSDARFNPALVPPEPPSLLDGLMLRLGLREPDPGADLPEDRQRAAVLEKLQSLYVVIASTQHNVIDIRAQHPDPVLAAQVANEIARLYIDMRVDEQIAELDRDIRFMRQRSQEIAASLSEQQTRITSLMLENQLLDDSVVRTLLAEQARLRIRLDASVPGSAERQEIEERIAQINTQLEGRVGAEIRLGEHQIVLETETSRLDAINKRLDTLEAQRQSPSPNVVQISAAEVPSAPAGPNIASTLAVAFVVLVFLSVVGAFVREGFDGRVRYQEDAERLTGLAVLATPARIPRRMLRRHGAPHLCVAHDASPGYSNAVRALVSAAMEGAEPAQAPIVCICSAGSAEGKTSIASSMAVAAAMDDLRVLLIDFDVHRFGLTTVLGVLRGKTTFGEAFSDPAAFAQAVRKTRHAGVDLLNFRPGSRMSRRVLWSEQARDVIRLMRGTYDLVIADMPPFFAAEEAGRLHGIVDKAILVSRWGKADRESLPQTARMMRRSGLPVIGIAINAIGLRAARSYGYPAFREDYYRIRERSHA